MTLGGKTVQSGTLRTDGSANRLSIQSLPAGIYMLQVKDENETRSARLIVQ
jgi:hypothetical protein